MTEEVQDSVDSEVAPQEQQEVNDNDAAKAKQEADERNWKAMRIKNADLERRLKERDEMLDKFMNMQLNQQQKKAEPDEFADISDDEFIPLGKVKQLTKREAERYAKEVAKKEVDRHLEEARSSQFMDRLQRQYSDFNEIVNPETLSLLEEKEPELATTIAELKDPYKIGMHSYKYIKALGLVQKAPEARREKEVQKAIEKSDKAIQSPMAHDKRPIAQAFQLTDAMKKDLYREMHQYAAMASSVPEMS